jgi:hypothetical protein
MSIFLRLLCTVGLAVNVMIAVAQTGGHRVYSFLDLPSSARLTASGSSMIAIVDHDVSLAYHNPALLNPMMHNRISAATAAYYAGVNFGYFGYARDIRNVVMLHGGIQYVAMGSFTGADVTGVETGQFSANDIALTAGVSRAYQQKYNYGVNIKLIASSYEKYNSFGMSTDWAAAYHDSARQLAATLLLKNIGFQFKPYIEGNREPLPFEIQLGFSKRLKHLPFRIGVIAHNLQRFNMRYEDDSGQKVVFGDTLQGEKKSAVFFDNVARHFIVHGEFYFGKALTMAFGYNHHRRREMAVESKRGLTGFSVGVGVNIKMFSLWYSRGRYHIAGVSNHFTIALDVNRFMKKNKVVKESKVIDIPELQSEPPVEN